MIQNTLDALLEQRNLTVPELSEISGINEATLDKIAKDPLIVPSSETLDKLCRVFEVTPGTILTQIVLRNEKYFTFLSEEERKLCDYSFRRYWIMKQHFDRERIKPLDSYKISVVRDYARDNFLEIANNLKYYHYFNKHERFVEDVVSLIETSNLISSCSKGLYKNRNY